MAAASTSSAGWLARGSGVGGYGPVGHGTCLGFIVTAGDMGLVPALAAEPHEVPGFPGCRPGCAGLAVHRRAAGQVERQAQDHHVPADAYRTGAELGPPFIADARDVLDLQSRLVGRLGRQPHFDPAHLAPELPGGEEALRWVTPFDRAARVAYELVTAAELQITRDRQEPSGDALGIGTRIPDVLDSGAIRPADGDGARLARLQDPRADRAPYSVDLLGHLDHGALPPSVGPAPS